MSKKTLKHIAERSVAFRKLSFHSRKHGGYWYIEPPPQAFVKAQLQCSDGSKLDRKTALYGIGCRQGNAAAQEYVEFLRRYGAAPGGELQSIVLDMLRNGKNDYLARGHAVGFLSLVDKYLVAAVASWEIAP